MKKLEIRKRALALLSSGVMLVSGGVLTGCNNKDEVSSKDIVTSTTTTTPTITSEVTTEPTTKETTTKPVTTTTEKVTTPKSVTTKETTTKKTTTATKVSTTTTKKSTTTTTEVPVTTTTKEATTTTKAPVITTRAPISFSDVEKETAVEAIDYFCDTAIDSYDSIAMATYMYTVYAFINNVAICLPPDKEIYIYDLTEDQQQRIIARAIETEKILMNKYDDYEEAMTQLMIDYGIPNYVFEPLSGNAKTK